MKKIVASLFVICFVLTMLGTADMCAAEDFVHTAPQLIYPPNEAVVTLDSLTFRWTEVPHADYYGVILPEYIYGLNVTSEVPEWTIPKNALEQLVHFDPRNDTDTIHWFVATPHVDPLYADGCDGYIPDSETWSFNVLKTPVPWIDNTSWETYGGTYTNNNTLDPDYQVYLILCDTLGRPPSGEWWPYVSSSTSIYTLFTLSSTPRLSWTNWDDDLQPTPTNFADRYRVQLSTSLDFGNLIADSNTTEITYTTPELSPGAYYWRVRSERTDGLVTEWSSPCKFIIVSRDGSSDTDGDGVDDSADAFPTDPAASVDTDGDGYPDAWNPGMNESDSTSGLELDAFPNDPAASVDTDGDGFPDAWNPGMDESDSTSGLELDAFPNDPDEDTDTDNDGIGDNEDTTPGDPDDSNDPGGGGIGEYCWVILIFIIVVVVVAVAFMLMRRRKSPKAPTQSDAPPQPQESNNQQPPPQQYPPPPPPPNS